MYSKNYIILLLLFISLLFCSFLATYQSLPIFVFSISISLFCMFFIAYSNYIINHVLLFILTTTVISLLKIGYNPSHLTIYALYATYLCSTIIGSILQPFSRAVEKDTLLFIAFSNPRFTITKFNYCRFSIFDTSTKSSRSNLFYKSDVRTTLLPKHLYNKFFSYNLERINDHNKSASHEEEIICLNTPPLTLLITNNDFERFLKLSSKLTFLPFFHKIYFKICSQALSR